MAFARGPAGKLAARENRADDRDIHGVVAAAERVVVNEDIASHRLLPPHANDLGHHRRQQECVHGKIFVLLEHAP